MDMNDELIQAFIDRGYIEVVGTNQVGDPLYKFTELFYQEQYELVEYMRLQDSDILFSLWAKGYIDTMLDDKGMAHLYLTDKSDLWIESEDLTDDEKSMMYLIYSTESYVKEEYE